MPNPQLSADISAYVRDIEKMLDGFTRGPRKQILRKAARPVRQTAKSLTPVRQAKQKSGIGLKPNPYYGRKTGAKKKGKGDGEPKAHVHKKNLQRSIKVLRLNKSNDIFVGPDFGKKLQGDVGRTISTANGYYAQMVFGSARAFYNRVLGPALQQNRAKVLEIIRRESRAKLVQFWVRLGRKAA